MTAWSDGVWLDPQQVAIGLDDLGFMLGVVAVDRLRTCGGRPLDVAAHVERWLASSRALGIEWPAWFDATSVVEECVRRNRESYAGSDFSIVLLATPGRGQAPGRPTLIVHTTAIPRTRLEAWYQEGQTLLVAENRNVPGECWSPTVKTRARLQYYLADRQARSSAGDGSGCVLLDIDGHVTETAIANLMIVEAAGRRIVSPPPGSVLEGISLRRTLRLAADAGLEVVREKVTLERAAAADELLLSGSTGCLWSASRLGDRSFPRPAASAVLGRLQAAWFQDIGWDFVASREPSGRAH